MKNLKEKRKIKNNKTDVISSFMSANAITLISLVITIILLIILASIAIEISLGENGIFRRAKEARNKYLIAEQEEQKMLNELYSKLGIEEDLPENTSTTIAGTKVKLPEEWAKITPIRVEIESGKEVVASRKVSSVYAVALGEGKTVPVPNGFYYVGGNLETGVVISDNENDENKYANNNGEVTSGVRVEEVEKEGVKKLEFIDEIKGNQFVWIPCEESEYHKSNWANEKQGNITGRSTGYWDTQTSTAELTQIEKYGGFYVARYEAGLPTSRDGFTGDNGFISSLETTTDYLMGSSTQYNYTKTPISKAGREPWTLIDYNNAWASAKKMYNTESVKSGLITGTQWDLMLNTIESADTSKSVTDSKSWGNYGIGEEFVYTGRAAEYKSEKLYGYGDIEKNSTKENNKYKLLTTGASEHNKSYNIYDVAGNLIEWTEESTAYNSIETLMNYRCFRAGACSYNSATFPACFRDCISPKNSPFIVGGFRVVLYII